MSNIFHDPALAQIVLCGLRKQRDAGLDLDLRIMAEGKPILAHRNVIMASSPYFEALLGPNMREGKESQIELQNIKFNALNLLIDFIYSGTISIDESNVQDLLETANFIGMVSICKACCDFMGQHINQSNCVDLFNLAITFHQEELKEKVRVFLLGNMYAVAENGSINQLSVENLFDLLNDCNINILGHYLEVVPSMENFETALFKVVVKWIENNKHVEAGNLINLLKAVRLPHLPETVLRAMLVHPVISDLGNGAACDVVRSVLNKEKPANPMWAMFRTYAGLEFSSSRVFAETPNFRPEVIEIFNHQAVVNDLTTFVTGMDLHMRRWDGRQVLGGLVVHYSNGRTVKNGGDHFGLEVYHFRLEQGERINKVMVRCGWLIDNLTFYTSNQRQLGGFGGGGGGQHISTAPEAFGYLSYVSGAVVKDQFDLAINKLQFHWGHYKFPKADPPEEKNNVEGGAEGCSKPRKSLFSRKLRFKKH